MAGLMRVRNNLLLHYDNIREGTNPPVIKVESAYQYTLTGLRGKESAGHGHLQDLK
jgi:hypothetical protein